MGVLAYIVVYVILPILAILFIALLVIPLAGVGDRLRGAFGLLGLGTWTGFRLVTRWIAPVIAALLVGGVLDRALNKNREKPSTLVPLVLGLVVMAILLAIPIVGRWLLASLVGMFGLGAMILYLRSGGMRVDAAPVAPPAAVPASGPAADQPTV